MKNINESHQQSIAVSQNVSQEVKENTTNRENTDQDESITGSPHFNPYTIVKDNFNNQDEILNGENNSQLASARNSIKKQPKSIQSEPEWLRMKRTNVEIFKKIGRQNQSKQKDYSKEENKEQEKSGKKSNEKQKTDLIRRSNSQNFFSEQGRSFDEAMNQEAQYQFYMQLMNSNPNSPQNNEIDTQINLINLGQETQSPKNKSSGKKFQTQEDKISKSRLSPLGLMTQNKQQKLKNLVIVSDSSNVTPQQSSEQLALNKSIKIMSRNVTLKDNKNIPGKRTLEGNYEKTAYLPLVNEVEENETTKEQISKNFKGGNSANTDRLSNSDVRGQVNTEVQNYVDSQNFILQNDYTEVLSDDIKPLNSLNNLEIKNPQIDIKLKNYNEENTLNISQKSQSNGRGSFDKRYQNVYQMDKTLTTTPQSSQIDKRDRIGNEPLLISQIEIQSKKQFHGINDNSQKYHSNSKDIPNQSSLELGINGVGQNRIFNGYKINEKRTSLFDSLQITVLDQKYSNNQPQKNSEKNPNQLKIQQSRFSQKHNDSLNQDSSPQPQYSLKNYEENLNQSQQDELNIEKRDSNLQTEDNNIILITERFQTAPTNKRNNIFSQANQRGKTPQLQANQLLTQYMVEKKLPLQGAHMGKFQNLGSQWPNNLTPRSATADNVMKPAWREVLRTNKLLKQNIPWEAIAHQVSDIQQYTQEISLNKKKQQILSEEEKLSLKSKKGTIDYDGIVSIAENGSLRVRNDCVNKHQNPFKTYEFLKQIGSPRLNQKTKNNFIKGRRQTLNLKKNLQLELPLNLQNIDLEYKIIRERLKTFSTQESKQINELKPDIIYSQEMAENQYLTEMSINNKIKSYDMIEQMIKQQLQNHQNDFGLLKGQANRKILIKLQQNKDKLKKFYESAQESKTNTNLMSSVNTPVISFGNYHFNDFNELIFRRTPQESANNNGSNYDRKNSQIEKMSQLSKINEGVIVGEQIIGTRKSSMLLNKNQSKLDTPNTKQNAQFSQKNSQQNDQNGGLYSLSTRGVQPFELDLENKQIGYRVKSQGSSQVASPRNLYRKMKVPGSSESAMLQLEIKEKKSQKSQDSQKTINTHDHDNTPQEHHKMASRLETILSSRNKQQHALNLKSSKQAELDNPRNTQTFQGRASSQPMNKGFQNNNLKNENILSASFKKLFDQIDEDPQGDELNKLANQNFQSIIESQKVAYEYVLQQQKEKRKNISPSVAKANFKSGNGKVYGIRGNPFKEQTVGQTKDGRIFAQSILRPIVQEEIRQFNILDKTKTNFQNFEINGKANIETNKQKRIQKKKEEILADSVVNPANKNIKINNHTPKNDTPLSRLTTQLVENLTLPSSSILSQILQDGSRQVTLKLQSSDQSKRKQTFSKLSNLKRFENGGEDIQQVKDQIVNEAEMNSSSEKLSKVHKMEQEILTLVGPANETQDYIALRQILKSQDARRSNNHTLQLNSLQSFKASPNEEALALSPLFYLVGQKAPQGLRLEPVKQYQNQKVGTSSNMLSPFVISTIAEQRKNSENSSINEIENNNRIQLESESITWPGHLSPKQNNEAGSRSQRNSKILITVGSNKLETTPKYDQFYQDQDVVEVQTNIRIF